MASAKNVVLQQLGSSDFVLMQMLTDLSDEEYFKPPVKNGNHAAWIVGHIAVSEDSMTADLTGRPKRIDEATHALFKSGSTCHADASKYPPRKRLDELYRHSRAHAVEALKMYDESKWDSPAPGGYPTELFPTRGSVWGLMANHPFWHIGQLAVCREVLGKKRVLG